MFVLYKKSHLVSRRYSFLFPECEVVTSSDVSKDYAVPIFRVTDLLQVDVRVMQSKKFVSDFGLLEGFGPSRVWKTRRGYEFVRN
jgi:hypothetical protein